MEAHPSPNVPAEWPWRERSALAKTIAALVADREARQRYLGNAQAGRSAVWLFAPTEDRADELVGFLADYNYGSLRYYGDQVVKDIHRDVDDSPSPP
jgi:hypothetical protein